jgi:hypothetical protein
MQARSHPLGTRNMFHTVQLRVVNIRGVEWERFDLNNSCEANAMWL